MNIFYLDKDDAIVSYKVAHLNHPSTIWARTSKANIKKESIYERRP